MMRVDCNDIWANLKQIEGGITSNVFKAFDKVKNKVIKEWEENTGQKWPVLMKMLFQKKR